MTESPENLSDTERRLRAASELSLSRLEARPLQTEKLLNRARREIGMRDIVTFGFTNLLGGFLHLIAVLAHRSSKSHDTET